MLLPIIAEARFYTEPSYGSKVVIVPPAYPTGGGNTGIVYNMPFQSPQAGQRRLLEMLETGGVEQPVRRTMQQDYVYSGLVYSEGAIVRREARR